VLAASAGVSRGQSAPETVCQLRAHVSFSNPIGVQTSAGDISADTAHLDCTGSLAGRSVSGGSHRASVSGSYGYRVPDPTGPQFGADTCTNGIGTLNVDALLPVTHVAPNQSPDVELAARLGMERNATAITIGGSALADPRGRPARYRASGDGAFTPDPGQDCVTRPWSSGTLTLHITLTPDPGGAQNPASAGAQSSDSAAGGSATPSAPAARHRCHRHRCPTRARHRHRRSSRQQASGRRRRRHQRPAITGRHPNKARR
jgi:hypothetical protein